MTIVDTTGAAPVAYTRKAAAAAVGISVRELDRHIELGHIDTRRVGRRVLVPRVALLRWLHIDEDVA